MNAKFRISSLGGTLRVLAAAFVVSALAVSAPAVASAAPPAAMKVSVISPQYVTAGKGMIFIVNMHNLSAEPIGDLELTYTLPPGIEPINPDDAEIFSYNGQCEVSGQQVHCTFQPLSSGSQERVVAYQLVEDGVVGTLEGSVEVSGGGESFSKPLSFTVADGQSQPFSVESFEMAMADTSAWPASMAGATPAKIESDFTVSSHSYQFFGIPAPTATVIAPNENFRNIVAHIPPGFVGLPEATPEKCTQGELVSKYVDQASGPSGIGVPACPLGSQVGLARVNTGDIVGLYNLVPPPRYPAAFGFLYNGVVVTLLAHVRPSDHGIDLVVRDVANSVPIAYSSVTFWGVPADTEYAHLRGSCLLGWGGYNGRESCPYNSPPVPFLRNPTSCSQSPPIWGLEMNSYQHPETYVSAETTTAPIEGCERVPFEPDIRLDVPEKAAAQPGGLDVEIEAPQERGADGLSEADMRAATVRLPDGVTINPASADQLGSCSDEQLRLGLDGASRCPDAAKVGTLKLTTPVLAEPLEGSVYLRSQASNDPESGDLFRLALEIRSDERGVYVKLPGSLKVNPNTGQLTTSFQNLPQLPFESMRLHLKTGPRAPLTMPRTCGTYSAHAEFEGWNGKLVTLDPTFAVDRGCTPPPFAPGFEAGVSNARAGEFAPFSLRVTRGSNQPNVSRIVATLPEGELAKLAGLPVCGSGPAAGGDCPAGSRIGSVVAGIGEGSNPLYLPQQGKAPTAVYFAGPYKGAPYSVVTKVPAQAGPFDLGQVLVRSAVRIDPVTAQVSVASDPLPQIFQGVPVSYRDVRIIVDRPGFTLNPTDCEPMAVEGSIASIEGQTAHVSDRFQVGDCARLAFKPELSLRLKGGTRRSDHPALRATLTMPKKGANIARASIALPHSEFLAQNHIRTVCTRVQFTAGAGGGAGCPEGSVYGRATAYSPLLDRPLSGPVYLRSSDNPLPDLVAALDGQIHVDLVGRIDSDAKGGIRTTFATVPDAPVSKFVLRMQGGKKGLLENSTDLCRSTKRASAHFTGQNGKLSVFSPALVPDCRKAKGKGNHRGNGR